MWCDYKIKSKNKNLFFVENCDILFLEKRGNTKRCFFVFLFLKINYEKDDCINISIEVNKCDIAKNTKIHYNACDISRKL